MKVVLILINLLGGCAHLNKPIDLPVKKPLSFSEKRYKCINSLMGQYKEFSSLPEITSTCKEIIICNTCGIKND